MKRLLLPILLWCALSMPTSAQTRFVYEYDANGNVVSRTKVSVANPQNGQSELAGYILNDVIVEKQEGTDLYKVSVVGNKGNSVNLQLYDASSQLLDKDSFTGTTHTVDLSEYSDGVYILEVEVSDEKCAKKLLKN